MPETGTFPLKTPPLRGHLFPQPEEGERRQRAETMKGNQVPNLISIFLTVLAIVGDATKH